MITVVPSMIVLSASPKEYRAQDLQRIGAIAQNQEAVANIFVRPGGDGHARTYIKLAPGGDFVQDLWPSQQSLWAYSDVDGAILTYWEKYSKA